MKRSITILRRELQGFLPKEVRAESRMYLSSVYQNRQPLKGISAEEEKRFLNGILDVGPDHVDWPKHTKKYWADLTIMVPFGGVELDISTDSNDDPINIEDYIRYKWLLKHPQVGLTKEEMDGNVLKRFYVKDYERDLKFSNNKIKLLKDADKEFIKLSDSESDMRRVFRLLSNQNPDTLGALEVENILYSLKSEKPAKFIKIARDKHLKLKSEIEEMVTAGILRKIGNQIIYQDEVLGDTMRDTVVHLNDKKNSGKLTILRVKLKESTI
jgi:hypothetical protein